MRDQSSEIDEILKRSADAGWKVVPAHQVRPGTVRPAQNFNIQAKPAFTLPGTRRQWKIGTGLALLGVFAAATLVKLAAPSPVPENNTPPQAWDPTPTKTVMGTGPAYVPPEKTPRTITAMAGSSQARTLRTQRASKPVMPSFIKEAHAAAAPLIGDARLNFIRASSIEVGLHPELLIKLFGKESGFKSNIVSDTGASGLCQFTKGSFWHIVGKYGHEVGLTEEQKYVLSLGPQGYNNPEGHRILSLRNVDTYSVPLCARHVRDDLLALKKDITKRTLNFTDSSFVHFTGYGAARGLLSMRENPEFRHLSAAQYAEPINYLGNTNRSVFFENGGRKSYTIEEVYQSKRRKMGDTPALLEDLSLADRAKLKLGMSLTP